MTIEAIAQTADQIKRKYNESDPWKLAQALKIQIAIEPMGTYKGCCKGFFIIHRRIKLITINGDLPEILQRIVLAHEIGHCVLHAKQTASAAFHDIQLFDTIDTTEYEANVFAAELLLSDEEVISALNQDMFFFQVASTLCVPSELLDFKFRILKRRGYKVESPITAHGDFMKNMYHEREQNE